MFVKIDGETHYLWRAVNQEGEVLEGCIIKKLDKEAALRLSKKALKTHRLGKAIATYGLPS